MLIRGDEGVDIDIREECGYEMGDGPEKNSEACNEAFA
jgi:biotin operon repressor